MKSILTEAIEIVKYVRAISRIKDEYETNIPDASLKLFASTQFSGAKLTLSSSTKKGVYGALKDVIKKTAEEYNLTTGLQKRNYECIQYGQPASSYPKKPHRRHKH